MKDIELLPCPFCGRKAFIIETYCKETDYRGYYVSHNCFWGIKPIKTYSRDTMEEAAGDWNRRVGEENE